MLMRKQSLVILFIGLVFLFSACAKQRVLVREDGTEIPMGEATPLEKAGVIAKELDKQYTFIKRQAASAYAEADEETKAWMRIEINPKVNKAKRLLNAYVSTVITWKTTGSIPTDIYEREKAIRSILIDILTLFINH